MKIFNFSKISCNRKLWHDIAEVLGVNGRMEIRTCPWCTSGTIFRTYLEEVALVWLCEYHEDQWVEDWIYEFCEDFARCVFKLLGGKILKKKACDRYRLPKATVSNTNMNKAYRLFDDLKKVSDRKLKDVAFSKGRMTLRRI